MFNKKKVSANISINRNKKIKLFSLLVHNLKQELIFQPIDICVCIKDIIIE